MRVDHVVGQLQQHVVLVGEAFEVQQQDVGGDDDALPPRCLLEFALRLLAPQVQVFAGVGAGDQQVFQAVPAVD